MKQAEKSREKISITVLGKILAVIIMILLCAISFGGIYVANKNSTKNLIKDYELGLDLYGGRNIVIKVDTSSDDTSSDSSNTEENTEKTSSEENAENTQNEEIQNQEANSEEASSDVNSETNNGEKTENETTENNEENYKKAKEIIEKRLAYMQISDYIIRLNKEDGTITLNVPEDSKTDYVAQYCITPGVFKMSDKDTGEVLISNKDIKDAKVGYNTTSSGTTVYLTIEFNKDGKQKLNEISKTYVSSKDADGNDTSKKIDMKLDDETILSSYFEEEITDGIIQLSIGTATDSTTLKTYLQQASNIAIFLNTESLPLKYTMEINRFVFSNTELSDILPIVLIIAGVIGLAFTVYMIIKYKKTGLLGIISTLAFVALLLINVREGNVELTISGIFTIILMSIIEAIVVINIMKEYKKDLVDGKNKMKELLKKTSIVLLPLLIIAITFAFSSFSTLTSIGMIMFWAIIIMALYDILVLGMLIFRPENK